MVVTGVAVLAAASVWASTDAAGPAPGTPPPGGIVATTTPDGAIPPETAPSKPAPPPTEHDARSRRGGKALPMRARHHGPARSSRRTRPPTARPRPHEPGF
ncbi:hypothetical protein [Microbispora sp. H10836]|uniref:hypothetical protein n=1 Tax=Microbispora sp. H10836 TaxID=2729106 RepID=UPI001473EBB6|nr:hypothetical protein [Microbispora sp. H10836]